MLLNMVLNQSSAWKYINFSSLYMEADFGRNGEANL